MSNKTPKPTHKKKKTKKLRWFKISGIIQEAKRIQWPSFKEVLQKTGVVLVFTTLFALFFAAINFVLARFIKGVSVR